MIIIIGRGLASSPRSFPSTKFQPRRLRCSIFTPNENNRCNSMRIQATALRPGEDRNDPPPLKKVLDFGNVLWRFLRPYVIRTSLVVFSTIVARTMIEHTSLLKWSQLLKALAGLGALLCLDGYIEGINQIFDVEIDRINKPYLPIAAGDLSLKCAWLLVTSFAAIGISCAGVLNCSAFSSAIYGEFLTGTLYSVPPFRLKTSTMGAICLIALRRGWVFLGASSAARTVIGLPFVMSAPVIFMSISATIYASVIAVLKDLSDIEGDEKFNVPTLATRIGVRNTAFVGCGLLLLNYMSAISAATYMPQVFKHNVMVSAHTFFALCLIFQAWKLDKEDYNKEACQVFYQFIRKLMDAEYALYPFI